MRARRSLSSKVVSQYSSLLSPMAVDCVLKVLDPARPELCAPYLLAESACTPGPGLSVQRRHLLGRSRHPV